MADSGGDTKACACETNAALVAVILCGRNQSGNAGAPVLDFDRTARENDERCRDDENEKDDATVRKLSTKVFYSFYS